MHQAAEQVKLVYFIQILIFNCFVQMNSKGSAKTVSLIKAVKPTSVNDMDMNGYLIILIVFNFLTFSLNVQPNTTALGNRM